MRMLTEELVTTRRLLRKVSTCGIKDMVCILFIAEQADKRYGSIKKMLS